MSIEKRKIFSFLFLQENFFHFAIKKQAILNDKPLVFKLTISMNFSKKLSG